MAASLIASGIYSITNTVDGKVYIGSAVNLQQRWWDHRAAYEMRKAV